MTQILHLQDSVPEFFQVSGFASGRSDSLFYGFFGSQGGVSRDVYSSLNCGRGSGDNPENVVQNLQIVADIVGGEASNLLTLKQVHSAKCLVVDTPWSLQDRPEADAFVTKVPGVALGVLTADCTPVLFSALDADGALIVGAAHAGWGGAFGGVLEATVEKLLALGAVKNSIEAAIGPCIGQESYEVSVEFFDKFCAQDKSNAALFIPSVQEGHKMFDLPAYCARRLRYAGVNKVFVKALDTYFNEADFFSYRRATHRGEADYGRQISVISIRDADK